MKDKKFKMISILFGILFFALLMFQSCVAIDSSKERFKVVDKGYVNNYKYVTFKDSKTGQTYILFPNCGAMSKLN